MVSIFVLHIPASIHLSSASAEGSSETEELKADDVQIEPGGLCMEVSPKDLILSLVFVGMSSVYWIRRDFARRCLSGTCEEIN